MPWARQRSSFISDLLEVRAVDLYWVACYRNTEDMLVVELRKL